MAASLVIPASHLPARPLCPFKLLTGLPCPGCGLSHAFCDISSGHFQAAWQENPFGFLFYLLGLGFLLGPWLRVRFLEDFMRRTRAPVWAPGALLVGMWIYDLVRIARL